MPNIGEETLRAILIRMLTSQSEIETQNNTIIQRTDALITVLSEVKAELARHGQVEATQAGIVARLETALTAEATEVARLRALKMEGRNGWLTIAADPKVRHLITFIAGAALALWSAQYAH